MTLCEWILECLGGGGSAALITFLHSTDDNSLCAPPWPSLHNSLFQLPVGAP